jgi:hypothetical protein
VPDSSPQPTNPPTHHIHLKQFNPIPLSLLQTIHSHVASQVLLHKLQAAGTILNLDLSVIHNIFGSKNTVTLSIPSQSNANQLAMADTQDVTTTPPQPQPNSDSHHHPRPATSSGHEDTTSSATNTTTTIPTSPFIRPADLLRPRLNSVQQRPKADRPIDRDERLGLVS